MNHHDSMPGMSSPPPSPDSMGGGGDMVEMHMTFFWGKNTEILFSGWPGYDRLGMYILALIVIFLFAVIAEFLGRGRFLRRQQRLVKMVVYGFRAGLGYLVMLAIMSFNGGVFIAAVIGHCVGFLLFGEGEAAGKNAVAQPVNAGCV